MRTIKLTLEYDGTGYVGWQYQPNGPTIQEAVEEGLHRVLGGMRRIHGAGRTDAGVHARGQVAHFTTEHPMPVDVMCRALNATLPRDVAVLSAEEMPVGFHARKSARRKRYVYQILNRRTRAVFLERYAWHVRAPLDLEGMRSAGRHILGERDFGAFCAAGCTVSSKVRRIDLLEVVPDGGGLVRIGVEGNGFLRHMVRILVGTLVDVGLGRRSPRGFAEVLSIGDRQRAGKTAPAKGLFLEWVEYPCTSEAVSGPG